LLTFFSCSTFYLDRKSYNKIKFFYPLFALMQKVAKRSSPARTLRAAGLANATLGVAG
jgi:hypothetical protein